MNWFFKHPIRVIAWHVFAIPSVILTDFDGDETVAYVRSTYSGAKYAMRMDFHIHDVILGPNGKIISVHPKKNPYGDFVKSWENAPWNRGAVKIDAI